MDKAFKEMKVTDVTIPEGVTHIGDRAFYDMTSDGTSGEGTLKNIVLPSSLKDIGQYAFSGQGIVSLALPEGLETLGQGAFSHNTSMENVFIPESLSTVSKKAFYNDTSLIDDGNIYCTDTDERTCEDLLANATGSASTDAANNAAILSNIQYYTMEDTMYVVKDSQGNKTYFKSPATLMTGSVCDESCQTEILTELYPERYLEPDPVVENEDDNDDTAESEVSQPVGESISRESMRIYTVQEIAKVVRDDKNTIKVRYK